MKISNVAPFQDYTCYKNFHQKEGRMQVCLIHFETGKRTTITFAKFQMSVKLGRILTRDEEVDHKDEDKTNDDIDNLQILTTIENKAKWAQLKAPKELTDFICPQCSKPFQIEKRQLHSSKGKIRCCSRSCAAKRQFAK